MQCACDWVVSRFGTQTIGGKLWQAPAGPAVSPMGKSMYTELRTLRRAASGGWRLEKPIGGSSCGARASPELEHWSRDVATVAVLAARLGGSRTRPSTSDDARSTTAGSAGIGMAVASLSSQPARACSRAAFPVGSSGVVTSGVAGRSRFDSSLGPSSVDSTLSHSHSHSQPHLALQRSNV